MPSGQNTEVSDTHADARQNTMQNFVHPIKDPKQNRFHSAAPFGKDRQRAALIREGADELQGPFGCVLAVCIHHQHGVARRGLVDVGKTNGDGSLMAQISPQTQYPNGSHNRKVRLEIRRIAALSRAVVDQQDMKRARIRSNGPIQPANEFRGRTPVVAERHNNYDINEDAGRMLATIDGL
ncbi:hypothetical protein SBA7_960020 [Candidatus Sulfotelmatobacter sp. SbA7]|nr:hypothetical protein SBA7_960020 [Candidatus Sulfotelmatobacter sp. SbA7]